MLKPCFIMSHWVEETFPFVSLPSIVLGSRNREAVFTFESCTDKTPCTRKSAFWGTVLDQKSETILGRVP